MILAGYAITHNLTPFVSMQNHYNLLYREEEREMLPLLKVSLCYLNACTLKSDHLPFDLNHSAPRRWMYPVEPLGERCAHSVVGCDQRARGNGPVSVQGRIKKRESITVHSWAGIYNSGGGSEAIVQRFVKPTHSLPHQGSPLLLLSVEELAKKKGVKMAQIAVAWSLKKITAPIVGTTKLENLKEAIGERHITHHYPPEC